MEKKYYIYALLDSRKPGYWNYSIEDYEIEFEYEPFYIGKGTGSRISHHVKETANNPNLTTRKHQKIRSILKENQVIQKKIILNLENYEALELEVNIIELVGRIENNGPLVNLTNGGDGLSNPSEETRKKIGEASKNRILSESTREKLRANWVNKLSLMERIMLKRGISQSEAQSVLDEINIARSKKMREYRHTPETKLKISLANKGVKKMFSTSHRENISKSKKGVFAGEKNPMYGKTFYDVWADRYDSNELQKKTAERNNDIRNKNLELIVEADNNISGNYPSNVKIEALTLIKKGLPENEALTIAIQNFENSKAKGIKAKQDLDIKKFWKKVENNNPGAIELLHHAKILLELKKNNSINLLSDFNKALNKKKAPYRNSKINDLEKRIVFYGITLE